MKFEVRIRLVYSRILDKKYFNLPLLYFKAIFSYHTFTYSKIGTKVRGFLESAISKIALLKLRKKGERVFNYTLTL